MQTLKKKKSKSDQLVVTTQDAISICIYAYMLSISLELMQNLFLSFWDLCCYTTNDIYVLSYQYKKESSFKVLAVTALSVLYINAIFPKADREFWNVLFW